MAAALASILSFWCRQLRFYLMGHLLYMAVWLCLLFVGPAGIFLNLRPASHDSHTQTCFILFDRGNRSLTPDFSPQFTSIPRDLHRGNRCNYNFLFRTMQFGHFPCETISIIYNKFPPISTCSIGAVPDQFSFGFRWLEQKIRWNIALEVQLCREGQRSPVPTPR